MNFFKFLMGSEIGSLWNQSNIFNLTFFFSSHIYFIEKLQKSYVDLFRWNKIVDHDFNEFF